MSYFGLLYRLDLDASAYLVVVDQRVARRLICIQQVFVAGAQRSKLLALWWATAPIPVHKQFNFRLRRFIIRYQKLNTLRILCANSNTRVGRPFSTAIWIANVHNDYIFNDSTKNQLWVCDFFES